MRHNAPHLAFAPLILALLASSALAGAAMADPASAEGGRQVALRACAGCHAVEGRGDSPREDAPPFRKLYQRIDAANFGLVFQDGMMTSHSKMPIARLGADEVAALTAYLETLRPVQGPGSQRPNDR